MTVKQLAIYLAVNERTVLKLVQAGTLPGVKIGNQWRFRKPMIETWLDDQALGITPPSVDSVQRAPRRVVSLESCFDVANVVPDLRASSKTGIVVELAHHANQLGLVTDETWFVGALFQKEGVMPGAVADGFAVLHTLKRHPERVPRPFLVVGRSRQGVDFDALDEKATHLFFVLGLRYSELQLPWLSRVIDQVSTPETLQKLHLAEDAESIFRLVREAGTSAVGQEEIA